MYENHRKQLPISEPLITCYTPVAALFSILGRSEETNNWIFSNYINMEAYNYPFNGGIGFTMMPSWLATKFCPWIVESILGRNTFQAFSDSITQFFIKWIDLDYYIYLVVDEAQFKLMSAREYFPHDIFISGYDSEKEVFLIHDFTFNEKFSCCEIPFVELENAFHNLKPANDYINESFGGITLWKYKENVSYKFNLELVKEELNNYLFSNNPRRKQNFMRNEAITVYDNVKFGISVYEFLQDLIERRDRYLPKLFHDFYEHKLLMKHRLLFLNDKIVKKDLYLFIYNYDQLKDMMSLSCNLALKYQTTQNDTLLLKMLELLKSAKILEKETIEKLIITI